MGGWLFQGEGRKHPALQKNIQKRTQKAVEFVDTQHFGGPEGKKKKMEISVENNKNNLSD